MKCSHRSTTWVASLFLLWGTPVAGLPLEAQDSRPSSDVAGQVSGAGEAAAREAIVEAVRARVGSDADVRIAALTVRARGDERGPLVATPEIGARLGRPGRFSLAVRDATGTWPAGHAVATVFVVADCARVVRPVAAGAGLSSDDLVEERSELGDIGLQRVPRAAEAVGARTRRALVKGELLIASMFSTRRLVQSGDAVTIRATIDGVFAQSRGVATQSGGLGDSIRVVNAASRKALTARVAGAGEVEVIR